MAAAAPLMLTHITGNGETESDATDRPTACRCSCPDAAPVYEPAGDRRRSGPVICRYGLDRSTRPFATHEILQELRQRSVIVQTVLLEGIERSCEYTPP